MPPPSIRPAPELAPLASPRLVESAKSAESGESLIVLSDVHLGSDLNDLSPPDDVIRRGHDVDADLVRLIAHYRRAPAPDGRWRLVVAGDFIDFIGITLKARETLSTPLNEEEESYGLGNAEDHARIKLRRVATRHEDVFRELAAFVADGHALTFVHGNHDLEFHWPAVQAELRATLVAHALERDPTVDAAALDARIAFNPWFYLVDGVAYIEHGHQYDEYCSTDNLMAPLSPLDPRRIARGFCDVLLRRVVRPTRGLLEHGHETMGIADYLAFGARLGVRGMLQLGARFAGAVIELFRLRRQHFAEAGKALRVEHERRVGLLSEATRIGLDRLRSLAALQVPPVTRSIRGILASVLLDRLALGLFCSGLMIVAGVLAAHRGHAAWIAPVSIVVGWGLAHRALTRARSIDPREVLAERAHRLAKLFPVAFVVMGHTHVPQDLAVSQDARYINVGAWAEEEPPEGMPRSRAPRTHLVIRGGAAKPVADLLAWDPESATPRRFVA